MSFVADPNKEWEIFDFILGDFYKGFSIASTRYEYLYNLNCETPLKLAFHDPESDKWTKWQEFPGLLWHIEKGAYNSYTSYLTAAVDVHRIMLPNEIVIESDYKTYDENYEAARLIGKIIEDKGFRPLYYFSGNKSIHIHVFFDWKCLASLDIVLQDQLRFMFKESKAAFQRKFIEWIRAKMVSCWDTNARKFDADLIKPTHLVRCELSRNKLGYKTFLGYTYKDLSFVPYVCNELNRIYPKLGEIRLSQPASISELIQEFIESIETQKRKQRAIRKNNGSLSSWIGDKDNKSVRDCVGLILSNDFKEVNDGFKRSMFILLNELKRVFGEAETRVVMNDWNARMGFPIKEEDIEYRLKQKTYTLSCSYIHKFLEELGIDASKKCKHKIYK